MAAEPETIWEHPGDWHSQEGPFAKACSSLGYRLLSLADRTRNGPLTAESREVLARIDADVRAIGG